MKRTIKTLSCIGGLFAFSTMLLSSCSDEQENGNTSLSQNMSFAADIEQLYVEKAKKAEARSSATLSTTPSPSSVGGVASIDGATSADGKQLYLHTVITDSMDAPQEEVLLSRATPIKTATDMYNKIGLIGYAFDGNNWSAKKATTSPTFHDAEATKNGSIWKAPSAPWVSGKGMAVFAYAPYNGTGISLSASTATGEPSITYTVPAAVADQKDLLVSNLTNLSYPPSNMPKMTFKHALTAVRFVVGNGKIVGGTISKITLKNVYGKGVYNMESHTWTNLSDKKDFTQTLTTAITSTDKGTDKEITASEATFMMIPQQMSSDMELHVTYTDSLTGTERLLKAKLVNNWERGYTHTYRISTDKVNVVYNFNTTSIGLLSYSYDGASKNYGVISYATVTSEDGTVGRKDIAWEAEFSTDNGTTWVKTLPAWVSKFTKTGVGNTPAADSLVVTVVAQENTTPNPHTANLRAKTPVTDYNLALSDGKTGNLNTANCYIVNAPGTYRLPFVYGNAIKNGAVQTNAYTFNGTAPANVLAKFKDYKNQDITGAYIPTAYINDCVLVWQDEENLISNVRKDGNELAFEVKQGTIQQGNAIVAVRDADKKIVWSWHIWVTDYELYDNTKNDLKTVIGYQNKSFTMMPINLGWCDIKEYTYVGRKVLVRYTQAESGRTKEDFVEQPSIHTYSIGSNTFYQWGRKDPLLPSSGLKSDHLTRQGDKTCYTDADKTNLAFTSANQFATFGQSIQNPNVVYYAGQNVSGKYMYFWTQTTYKNLWSANETDYTWSAHYSSITPVKTIYDPSPAGYRVAPPQAYYNFPNGYVGAWDNGYSFYCNINATPIASGGTVRYPASGLRRRDQEGRISAVAYNGYMWSSAPLNNQMGAALHFNPDNANGAATPEGSDYSCGFPIRAVKE